jgi:hypothetical protein
MEILQNDMIEQFCSLSKQEGGALPDSKDVAGLFKVIKGSTYIKRTHFSMLLHIFAKLDAKALRESTPHIEKLALFFIN